MPLLVLITLLSSLFAAAAPCGVAETNGYFRKANESRQATTRAYYQTFCFAYLSSLYQFDNEMSIPKMPQFLIFFHFSEVFFGRVF
jgi:hypothetical protein